MERIVKGIWIPIEIWQADDLSWNEKVLLMEVDSFTQKGRDCYISNRYIADMFGVSERTASEYLTHLINAGYVKLVKFDGRCRYVESALPSLQGSIEENFKADLKFSSRQSGRKLQGTNNISDLNKDTDKERGINTPKEKTPPPFDLYKALIAAGVNAATAHDWLQVRKTKRCANTATAWQETQREIAKSGKGAEHCIRTCVAQSWGGFKAEWLARLENSDRSSELRPRHVDNITFMIEQRKRRLAEEAAQEQRTYNPQDDLPDEQ